MSFVTGSLTRDIWTCCKVRGAPTYCSHGLDEGDLGGRHRLAAPAAAADRPG